MTTSKQAAWQAREIASAPESYRRILKRAYSGEAPPRQAIKAACLRCVGYLRAEVRDCSSWACPLHAYRPYQVGDEEGENVAEGSELASQDASGTPG